MSIGKRLFVGGAAADSFCMNTSDNPLQEATSSLVAGYSLDYDASDITGDYDGTASNVTFGVDGYINWGAEFNGSSSKITLPSGSPFNDSNTIKSISAWVRLNSTSSRVYPFSISSSTQSNDFFNFGYLGDSNNILLAIRDGSSSNQVLHSVSVTIDTNWHHIVAQTTGTSVQIYLDGVSQTISSTYAGSGSADDWISYPSYAGSVVGSIGVNRQVSSAYSNGQIDQVRIFNKALSSSEVTTLYNESACTHTATTDTVGFPSTASSNLVAYYKLDGSAEDESSNSYDGTWSGTEQYEFGRYGTAASFDGSNSYIDLGNSAPFGDRDDIKAISGWVKSNDGNRVWLYTVSGTGDSLNWFYLAYRPDNNAIYVYRRRDTNNDAFTQATITDDGNWHHIVAQVTATEVEIYLDGSKLTTTNTNNGTGSNTSWIGYANYSGTIRSMIGKSRQLTPGYTDGLIDQVRFYDEALTQDEITELYNEKQAYITKDAENPFEDDDEVAFYKFENNADDEHDSYDGTASNVTFTSGSGLFGTYAASFNGTSSYIDLGTEQLTNLTEYSVSAWVNPNSSGTRAIVSNYGYNGTSESGWILTLLTTNVVRVYNVISGSNYSKDSTASLTNGVWNNVTITNTQSELKIYINGFLDSTHSMSGFSHSAIIDYFTIGAWRYNAGSIGFNAYFNGKIDQLRIFDRVLDGDEVFKLYAEVIN